MHYTGVISYSTKYTYSCRKEQVFPPETPFVLLSFCRQIASGMTYLALKNFVHRDPAARNILISKEDVCKVSTISDIWSVYVLTRYYFQIADFGMSRNLLDTKYYVSHGGKIPVKWTAPEALTYRKSSTASDVWSFGVVMYEIWAVGRKPYQRMTNTEVV